MEDAFGLSSRDLASLKRLAERVFGMRVNTTGRSDHSPADLQENQQTATYIAKTPPDGIPAMVNDVSSGDDPAPGNALCDTYQCFWDTVATRYVLRKTMSQQRRVVNLSNADIPGDTFIKTSRDNYGTWIADVPGSGSSTSSGGMLDICIVRSGGVMSGIRIKEIAGDGVTTTCRLADDCPTCLETGTVTYTGTVTPGTGTIVVTVQVDGTPSGGRTVTYSGGGTFVELPTGTYTLSGVIPDTGEWVSVTGYAGPWTCSNAAGSGTGDTATGVNVTAGGTTTLTFHN